MNLRLVLLWSLASTVFSFSLMAPVLGHSATYYVAKSGNNNYSCSQAQSLSMPKLTIAAGLACMKGGDTLLINDGTYAETIAYNQLKSGSSTTPTTVKAYNKRRVTLRPSTCIAGGNGTAVLIASQSYLTFDGLVIDAANCTLTGMTVTSLYGSGIASSNIRFANGEVKNAPASCVLWGGTPPTKNSILTKSILHDCGSSTVYDHGFYDAGTNNIFEYNEVYNISSYGYHKFRQSDGAQHAGVARFNYIHDNRNCIMTGSGDNNVVHNNVCARHSNLGIVVTSGSPYANKIYHNVVYKSSLYCVLIGLPSTPNSNGSLVKNNLCLSNGFNIIATSEGSSGTVSARNVFSSDLTLVVDAGHDQFGPRQYSPLIDAGEKISTFSAGTFLGSAPDIGAFEFGLTVPQPPPAAPNAPTSLVVAVE